MIGIQDVKPGICQIRWSLADPNVLIARIKNTNQMVLIEYKTGQQQIRDISGLTTITSMCQHPRTPSSFFFGDIDGKVVLFETQQNQKIAQYQVPTDGASAAAIKDIVYSPGEDVFLVVRKDGQMYLFGTAESAFKMEFPAP